MSAGLFTQIVNAGLIVLFILIIVCTLLAAVIGYKRGIWSATYRMIFMLVCIVVGICSLTAIANAVGTIDISSLIPYKTIIITNESSGVSYYAPITSIHDTLVSCFRGYYTVYHVTGSYAVATELAEAMASSVIKLASFIIIMVVIVVVGNILATLLWHLCFKRIIPKLARKRIKLPWASMGMNTVTFLVVGFLFLTPFTSMINIVNQNYKGSDKSESNQIVSYLDGFVESYDNSLFAQTFFNWKVNESTGLTLDSTILEALTQSTFENGSVGIISSIDSIADVGSTVLQYVGIDGNNSFTSATISQESIEAIFASLKDSDLVMMVLPIAATMCLNSGLLANTIDTTSLDLTDVEWKQELDVVESMAIDVANSGVIDLFVNEDGKFSVPSDITSILTELLSEKNYANVYKLLSRIDDSKLLSRALPAVVNYLAKANPSIGEYFPATFDELNDIQWGFEMSTLYDCLYRMYSVDNRIITVLTKLTSSSSSSSSGLAPHRDGESEEPSAIDIIVENLSAYSRIIVGETDAQHNLINLDSNGRTIVYSNGVKIKGRYYSLLDLSLCKSVFKKGGELLASTIGGSDETIKENVTAVMNQLATGKWIKNYKEEFNSLFYCLQAFEDDPSALNSLISGSIIPEGGSIADIDSTIIAPLTKSLKRMDDSKIIYAALLPTVKNLITSDSAKSTFSNMGLDNDIIASGIAQTEASHTFGKELAKLMACIDNVGEISDLLSSGGTSAEMISSIGAANESIAHVLDALYSCEIMNPSPASGETYTNNENYYNIMNYIFGGAMTIDGFSFKEAELPSQIVWTNSVDANGNFYHDRYGNPIYDGENGAIAYVLKVIGASNIIGAIDTLDFTSNEDLAKLENTYHLSKILSAVGNSTVFSLTMGDFLDAQLSSAQLVDTDLGVTFNNVTDWADEGNKLATILTTIGETSINFSNLNLNSVTDVVSLNNLLHALVDSSIFVDKTSGQFNFSTWLYSKVQSSLRSFSDGTNSYDLIKDPSVWDSDWGDKSGTLSYFWGDDWGEKTDYYLVYHDFMRLNEKSDWYSDSFDADFDTSGYIYGDYLNYWDNPSFIQDYSAITELDEIGRLSSIVYWVSQAANSSSITSMNDDTFNGLINSLNSTYCLRVSTYNFFEVAKSAFTNSTGSAFFDLSPAYTTYLVTCDQPVNAFDQSRTARAVEINYLTSIYSTYRYMVNNGILDSNNKIVTDKIDASFSAMAREAIKGIQKSLVFHRKGSILDPNLSDDTDGYYPTVFQNGLEAFLTADDLVKIIYNEDSPKDVFYEETYATYLDSGVTFATATAKQKATAKVDHILENYFDYAGKNEYTLSEQLDEVDAIFTVVDAIVGGPIEGTSQNYAGLRKTDNSITFDFGAFDMSIKSNITAVNQILNALNNTGTMYDCAPNSISRALDNASNYDILSGLSFINFDDTNVFYQYFDDANLSSTQTYNFQARLGSEDISLITDLLDELCKYQNNEESSFPDFEHITDSVSLLDNFLHIMNESKLFHTSGPIQSLSFDGSGNVVLSNASSTEMTVFQEMMAEIYNYGDIASCIFNANNPKDATAMVAGHYSTAKEKAAYLSKTYFDAKGTGDSLTSSEQSKEIDAVCDFITASNSFNINDFNVMPITDIDTDKAMTVLNTLNATETLYDAVPNLLYEVTHREFTAFDGVTLSDASVFYMYTQDGNTNYEVKYDEAELSNVHTILNDYQNFAKIVGSNSLNNLSVLKALVDNGYLYDVLTDAYTSAIIHQKNEYLSSSTHMTVFEQIINMLVSKANITAYVYEGQSNPDALMMARIKAVTTQDMAYQSSVTNMNTVGYHERWLNASSNVSQDDEIHSLITFVSVGQSILGESGNFDIESGLAMERINPTNTKELMLAINHVDFLVDALPKFVSDGFSGLGLGSLTTYNGTNYAYYHVGQYTYGGDRSSDPNIDYCEINNIYYALNNMQSTDSEGKFQSYRNIDNIIDLGNETTDFDGLMRFICHSRILNTNTDGTYNSMTALGSYSVSGRGVFLYNIFTAGASDPAAGANLGAYITGNSADEKVASLSKIFSLTNFDSVAEGKGLYILSHAVDLLDSIDFSSGSYDFQTIVDSRNTIITSMHTCYDANNDDSNVRSYLVSDIVSHILDTIMEKEYENIGTSYPYTVINYAPSDIGDITNTAYDKVNQSEALGLSGSVDAVSLVSAIVATSTYPTRSALTSAFTNMGTSEAGKIVYLSRIHANLGLATQSTAPVWTDYTSSVYASGFDFGVYGESLATYFALA